MDKRSELLERIYHRVKPLQLGYKECSMLIDLCANDTQLTDTKYLKFCMKRSTSIIQEVNALVRPMPVKDMQAWRDIYWRALKVCARIDFDSFLIYVERYRRPDQAFYIPRREKLYPVVQALNEMETGDLRELIINMPARVGKTTLLLFFVIWVMCRDTEGTSLYSAYSGPVTDKFYDGVLEVLLEKEHYAVDEIFPEAPLVAKHADTTTVDLGREKRYPSLTCRSIAGSLNGVCDASKYIFADDLVEGTEEARSRTRLMSKQYKVDNDLLRRETGNNLKIIWLGTPWSIYDPMSNRIKLLKNDPAFKDYKWKQIKMPGTDPETGESNFDYLYGKGFTTEQYARVKAGFLNNDDLASWETQVQCNPMEYFGALFPESAFKYYNGTHPCDQTYATMFVDPAWGGGDYCAASIVESGVDQTSVEHRTVPAVMCTKKDKTYTIPRLAKLIKTYNVRRVTIEANKMTRAYAEELQDELKARKIRCNVEVRPADNQKTKEYRIWDCAQEIKQLVFLDKNEQDMEYKTFMRYVHEFNPEGNNTHDDPPDCLAGHVTCLTSPYMASVQVGKIW